jgi:hypothetical protein
MREIILLIIVAVSVGMICFNAGEKKRAKRINAWIGQYPSCDMLNNALRFIRYGNIDTACEEIVFAIEKADGYFHKDNAQMVEDVKECWRKGHKI